MDKRSVARNRIDKPLFNCLGHMSSMNLELINELYDTQPEEDVLDVSIGLRKSVNLDAYNMSDEFMTLVNTRNYHQKLISKPAVAEPVNEYDWTVHNVKYIPVINELRDILSVPELYRLRMGWMKSTERIEPHIDQPHIDRFTMIMRGEHRFVITKRGVEHERIMKPGEVWYINTNWDHSVYIDTDEPRIALLGCFKYEKTLAISDDLSYN
mgnify:CR=1 FL=1|jgi:hypothetical protein|tara:strand:+ start:1110 stop:1742 length:633 start_codon:yes stop_codon:yes gene_type:complete